MECGPMLRVDVEEALPPPLENWRVARAMRCATKAERENERCQRGGVSK